MSGGRIRALVVVALLVGSGIAGMAHPRTPVGAAGWSLVVMAILWGWGIPVRRWLRVDLKLGEQMLAGTVVWILLSGVLLAFGVASRIPLFVLAAGGFAFAVEDLVRGGIRVPAWPRDELVARLALIATLIVFLGFNLVAMTATRGNPYDDHVAYTAFVRRLLDCGDLVEPFSFRRLSAYGGQTILQALAALRGDLESIDLLDRGIFQIIAVLLVIDLASRRRLHLVITTVVACFLLSMWDLDINSAPVWTGVACFLGAYSFGSRDDVPARTSLVLAFAACGASCTLRQNYLLTAGLFPALLAVFHLRSVARGSSWTDAWRRERKTIGLAIGVAAAIVVPYMIASFESSGTPLYPLIPGNFNPAAPMRPTAATWLDEVNFFITVSLYSAPIAIWWLLAPLMLLARDARSLRPWPAMLAACLIGFAFTVHAFMLSDAFDLWRYAYGYMTALAIVFLIEVFAKLPFVESEGEPRLRLPAAGTFLLVIVVAVHFAESRGQPAQRFTNVIANVKAAQVIGSAKPSLDIELYRQMQATIPAGATVAVMLDAPYLIDYSRNRIVNLDLPGFAAPKPGLPSFTDAEHWRAYFTSHGIRYLWFVDGTHSTWLYRRTGWVWRVFDDDELFRYMGAHIVDMIDSLVQLGQTSRVLYHDYNIFVIDLGPEVMVEADRGDPEPLRQDRNARRISENELGSHAWQLASRSDVVFVPDENGPSHVVPLPGDADIPTSGIVKFLWGEPLGDTAHRWLTDRSHVRVHGHGRHHLHLKVWMKTRRLYTVPTLHAVLDSHDLGRVDPDADGNATIDTDVECNGWCDLYLVMSTMSEWWFAAAQLHAFKLVEFQWTEAR